MMFHQDTVAMSQDPRESEIKDSFSSAQLHSLAGDTQPAEMQLQSLRGRRQLDEEQRSVGAKKGD